ncbi:diacylglycerol kinase [Streptomyces sp. NPDC005438]|uniref:diacylglycerol kinase n=1 Tax=Streptomyces sp. NPDC005438 TaxID=3156880 RepID=UPI0033A80740
MSAQDLLVVIDPAARQIDGESVRIARDVLKGGSGELKLCLPEGPEEFVRALDRRGGRHPVVIGDDHSLGLAVRTLYATRAYSGTGLSLVPVGERVRLARSLGVPHRVVDAARAVLAGRTRALDLLVDSDGGVSCGPLLLEGVRGSPEGHGAPEASTGWWGGPVRAYRALARTVTGPHGDWLPRVELDGRPLWSEPPSAVGAIALSPREGAAEVRVEPRRRGSPVTAQAARITVSGGPFRCRGEGPRVDRAETMTWSLAPAALRLTVG